MRRICLPLLLLALLGAPMAGSAGKLPFARETGGPRRIGFQLPELVAPDALEDVYVVPRRAGQNLVRWYGFEFKEILLPQLPGAGVRLFYYKSAEPAAEVAAALIREQYMELARAFEYVPEREVPYVLYGTHLEFQATNVFPIGEGTLGATSPADLVLALPFFGDFEQYRHTSTHELVHEFTIQAVKSYADAAGRPSALGGFPLWFIEGLAEYATYGGMNPDQKIGPNPEGAAGPTLPGLDPETEAWARDLLYQSSPFEGYMIFPYYSDWPRSYVHTYKLGQLRVAFLGNTFGRDFILWLLRNAHHMAGGGAGPFTPGSQSMGFVELVKLGTGFDEPTIQRMFEEWMKRRYLPAYADARTRVPAIRIVDDLPTEPESITSSPDGSVLMIRGFDREMGRATLYLIDAADPKKSQKLVEDSRPGLESLHLISRRTFAIGNGWVGWIGRSGPADILEVARIERRPKESVEMFRVHGKRRFDLVDRGILEAGDPTFSPDGRFIAFAGINRNGFKDVFILPLEEGSTVDDLRQVTDDVYGESGLYWSDAGIYLASDATPDGDSNLFLLDPESGEMQPLVTDPYDKETPVPTAGGLLFTSDRNGRWDLNRVEEDGIVYRLTDVPTQIRWPAPGPGGSVYGVIVHGGRFRLVNVPPAELQKLEPHPAITPGYDATPRELPVVGFPPETPDYEPFEHFSLDVGAVAVGTQSVAVGGLSFADLLRDKMVAISLAVYGDLDFTDASAIYLDRARRLTWLAGAFHTFQPKRDRTFDEPAFANDPDFYLERQFGVIGGISWPFNRYQRVDLTGTIEGVDRSRFTDKTGTREEEFERLTGGSEPQLTAAVSLGHDTLRWHPLVGPIAGTSVLATVGAEMLPQRFDENEAMSGFAEADLQHFFYLGGRATFWTRAAAGVGFGSRFSRQFYLSSVDNLRGFHWADERLLGTQYYVANAELSFPLDWLIRVALFEGLRGVGGVDFGGVTDDTDDLWDVRALNLLVGSDFLAGPLALRLLFGYPIQIGPVLPSDGWVTNFALRLRY